VCFYAPQPNLPLACELKTAYMQQSSIDRIMCKSEVSDKMYGPIIDDKTHISVVDFEWEQLPVSYLY